MLQTSRDRQSGSRRGSLEMHTPTLFFSQPFRLQRERPTTLRGCTCYLILWRPTPSPFRERSEALKPVRSLRAAHVASNRLESCGVPGLGQSALYASVNFRRSSLAASCRVNKKARGRPAHQGSRRRHILKER